MIEPTVGRIVWYWEDNTYNQPYAAIVVWVNNSEHVNISAFNSRGHNFSRHDVLLYQGEGDKPPYPYAEWMPYQKGQAAKTEALELANKKG